MDFASNGFVLICAALVFIMTPGLAFFYGGLARKKNVIDTMMASVGIMGFSILLWVVFGYTLSFSNGGGANAIIGGFDNFFLMGLSPYESLDGTSSSISVITYVIFQMMFAMITPAVVTGGGVGRMRAGAMFVFSMIWSVLVYFPLVHMVWGGGFLQEMGVIDFAGGFPIEVATGMSGLVLAAMLGKRDGFGKKSFEPHNKPYVFLGASILWFGWLGFNAGSSLHADGLAAHAFLTTCIIAATALCSWAVIDIINTGKPTLVGTSSGLVCGLVAATPTCGYIPVWAAFIIGAVVSPICYFSVKLIKGKLKIDDALDAFGCHGIGGIWGGIATGLFGMTSINGVAKWNGLVFGETRLFVAQIIGILVSIAVAVVGSLICIAIVRIFTPLRVEERAEKVGLDVSEHGENAYPSFNGLD